jgi:hypothetical protein
MRRVSSAEKSSALRIARILAPGRLLLVLCCIVLFGSVPARGQTTDDSGEAISSDRPSVTNSSVVVPKGGFQPENGMLFTDAQSQWTFDAPETLIRYGLFDKTELRLSPPDYFHDLPASPGTVSGFGDTVAGVKQQLGPLPGGFDLALIVFLSFPTGAKGNTSHGYDPGVQLPWSRKLSQNWTAAGQVAFYWPTYNGNRNFTGETTFLLDRQLTKPWDVFVEYAGDFPERNGTRQLLQFGSTYKITPHQQIDFHVAFGLSRAAADSFVGIGYSFLVRLPKGT